ncbi:MAG: hypothetical protein BMS9Abin30_1306 [Gammaproteobacteria bacterium]|nr:MAG: hypothetical protein BMS9Abin30_1306 [Gammaproteobacteria bacterium]
MADFITELREHSVLAGELSIRSRLPITLWPFGRMLTLILFCIKEH